VTLIANYESIDIALAICQFQDYTKVSLGNKTCTIATKAIGLQ